MTAKTIIYARTDPAVGDFLRDVANRAGLSIAATLEALLANRFGLHHPDAITVARAIRAARKESS